MTAARRLLYALPRIGLVGVLLLAWFAPPAMANETTCTQTETGWTCTVWVNVFGEGPSFTFTLTEETDIIARTFTSMTCDDWDNAPHDYAADPHLWLYSVDTEGVLTQIGEDDDGHTEVNDGSNMCWDAKIETTLQPGDYSLRADAYDVDYIGTYTLEFVNVNVTVPQPTPTPPPEVPEPTPEPDPTPTPSPSPDPEPTPTPEPTPQPTPIEDQEPEEPVEDNLPPAPEPTPTPSLPTPTPIPEPPTAEEISDALEDFIIDNELEFEFDFDPEDFDPADDEITVDELPEIDPEEFEDFEDLEPMELEQELELELEPGLEDEELIIEPTADEVDDEFLDSFEAGPPNEDDIYFDEETGEWEDDPDLELGEVDVEDLLESEEQLDELIAELETDDVLEEILEDNEDFFEEAEDEELGQLFESNPEIFNDADAETKEEFEAEVNVFEGAFDDYLAEGQNVTVGERRTIVAATAVVTTVATQIRPQPTTTLSPAGGGGVGGPSVGPTRRGRNR